MKKNISIIMIMALVVCLIVGCSKSDNSNDSNSVDEQVEEVVTPEESKQPKNITEDVPTFITENCEKTTVDDIKLSKSDSRIEITLTTDYKTSDNAIVERIGIYKGDIIEYIESNYDDIEEVWFFWNIPFNDIYYQLYLYKEGTHWFTNSSSSVTVKGVRQYY